MIPADPVAAVRDALLLLESGRAAMARRVLETLADAIELALRSATSEAYLRGQTDTHRMPATQKAKTMPKRPPPTSAPRRVTRLDWLRSMVAEPAQRERVRAILRLDDRILDRVLDGRAQLSETSWRALKVLR